MALARFLVLDVCAGVWYVPHDALGVRDEIASDCSCPASSSSLYHGKWRESQLLLGPSARLLLLSVSVASRSSEISFSRCVVRPRSPSSPISIGRVFFRAAIRRCTMLKERSSGAVKRTRPLGRRSSSKRRTRGTACRSNHSRGNQADGGGRRVRRGVPDNYVKLSKVK